MPFYYAYRLGGGVPAIEEITAGEAISLGDVGDVSSNGQLKAGANGATNLVVCLTSAASGAVALCCVDPNAVFRAAPDGTYHTTTLQRGDYVALASAGGYTVAAAASAGAGDMKVVRIDARRSGKEEMYVMLKDSIGFGGM